MRRAAALLPLAWVALVAGPPERPPRAEGSSRDQWVREQKGVPVPRAGWRMELVATPPTIKHPTMVEVAPDGRVFVAEDPMDISAPAHATLGRIVCLHPDGRVTVFADGLHAVFGLLYLDGKLFVLHNPKLSVFEDDGGVGRNRRDLIAQTNPEPWAGGWNDHVPANLRLGMDGWLYMAVGDKGLYGAVGTDGRRVDLPGGGIARLRPDGTGLEVFSTGVRNIMDVAIDAEDTLFTYDNTDEQQWMSRLTHMVDGGVYGYPHDFIPRRPYTLWMMADYGGGAATGALAYTDDALPQAFHGNLFLADFGKRQILRVPVAREGATYRPLFREDLIPQPPPDFRPVGLALDPDGASLYVTDWNHTDSKANVTVGRLYRLTYAGESRAAPRPSWYLPAALGRPFQASTRDLVAALAHPARRVRMVAQRRLAERGPAVVSALVARLRDRGGPSEARWHALWALDAIDGGRRGRGAILGAAADPDVRLRLQALRQLGTRRVAAAAPTLRRALLDGDPAVRFQAATALGRLGRPAAIPALLAALDDADPFARFAAFTALNRLGRADPGAWPAVARGLAHPRPGVREGASFALRATYDEALARALADAARHGSRPETRRLALELLADVHRKPTPWQGLYWGTHPASGPPPRKVVPWEGTPLVLAALEAGLRDPALEVRRVAVTGLGTAQVEAAAPRLRALLEETADPELRHRAVEALAQLGDRESAPAIARVLARPAEPLAVRAAALAAAARLGGVAAREALLGVVHEDAAPPPLLAAALAELARLGGDEAWPALVRHTRNADEAIRRAALLGVATLGGARAAEVLVPMLRDPSPAIRREVVAALGARPARGLVPQFLAAHRDPEARVEAARALARIPDPRALDVYLDGLGGRNPELRTLCAQALSTLADQVLPAIEARVASLRPELIAALQEVFDRNARARRGPLFAADAVRYEPEDYLAHALENEGDAAHGRRLFMDEAGVACARCHRVGGQGGDLGPDLSGIGAQSARRTLAESILFPSRVMREGYEQTGIELEDGTVLSGIVRAETPETLTLRDASGRTVELSKRSMKARVRSEVSLMPEGLHLGLSLQDFTDLVSYLETLR